MTQTDKNAGYDAANEHLAIMEAVIDFLKLADRIKKRTIITFLMEYYKKVAFIPNPEKEQTYLANM